MRAGAQMPGYCIKDEVGNDSRHPALRQQVLVALRLGYSKVLPHALFEGPIESLYNGCFHTTLCGEMLDW